MRLYAVTGGASALPLEEQVKQAISGGVTFLQFREKHLPYPELLAEAAALAKICREAEIPFVVNDDVQAALESGAGGVHVAQSDCALAEARSLLGPGKIIGVSAHTVAEAVAAERGGADYIGVGAMFSTATKSDAELVSFDELQAICRSVSIPVVAIGGIHSGNIGMLEGSGADGIAVVSALFSAPDIPAAAKELKRLSQKIFSE